jgi:hypothetical protein
LKSKIIIVIVLLLVIATILVFFISRDGKESTFLVSNGNLEIKSSFGITVPLAEISGLELKNEMPAIGQKTNGMGLGSRYKGEFTFTDGTKARLYVDASKPPFITFMHGSTIFYINTDTPGKTQELFAQLKTELE